MLDSSDNYRPVAGYINICPLVSGLTTAHNICNCESVPYSFKILICIAILTLNLTHTSDVQIVFDESCAAESEHHVVFTGVHCLFFFSMSS